MNRQTIGIDLGTYNSVAAYAIDENQVQIIKSSYGPTMQGTVFPSFLRYDVHGNVVHYGEQAREGMIQAPEMVVWGAKRLIGRSFQQIDRELWRFAYPIEKGADGKVIIPIGDHHLTPVDISTEILKWIRRNASSHVAITGEISKAVITHPAYFDTFQVEQTKEAAKRAGFDQVELIPEPVAAALAYCIQLDASQRQFIMAIDWGAGTLDIVIAGLHLNRDRQPILDEVKPARGHVALGGIDMDDLLLARTIELYNLENLQPLVRNLNDTNYSDLDNILTLPEGVDTQAGLNSLLFDFQRAKHHGYKHSELDKEALKDLNTLRDCIEKAKIKLSGIPAVKEYINYRGGYIEIKMARTRKDCQGDDTDWIILDEVLQSILRQFQLHIEFALKQSGLAQDVFEHVLLIGGPMHMPCIRQVVGDVFSMNQRVVQELQSINESGFPVDPMEAVAKGAALHAQGIGPRKGTGKINRDYGVLLGVQGMILLHNGNPLPDNITMPHTLSSRGNPGMPVSVGLFKREQSPEGEQYFRLGDYEFFPIFEPHSQMKATLTATKNGEVSLIMLDMLSGETMPLEGLSLLDAKNIAKPLPFETPPDSDPSSEEPLFPPISTVSEEQVSMARKKALTLLQFAESCMKDPLVKAEKQIGVELKRKGQLLKETLEHLPSSGPADQRVFQKVSNRRTELLAFLETHQFLSPRERALWSS